MIEAEENQVTCEGIVQTMVCNMPIVVQIMSIGHVFSDREPHLVASLQFALNACAGAAQGASLAVGEYLELDSLWRLAAANNVEKTLQGSHSRLRDRLDDIQRHLTTATLLKTDGVAEALQRAAQDVDAIRMLHAEMNRLRHAAQEDSERVRAVAKAGHKKRSPHGLELTGVIVFDLTSFGWSPNGRTLATPMEDNTAALWSAATGERLRTLEGHTDRVASVAWSPDGQTLATASFDKTAVLYSAASGERLRTLAGHTGGVQSVAWSPDGRTLATASFDKTAALWSAATGERLRTLEGHTASVASVVWSPDGRTVATASDYKTARLYLINH